VTEHAREDRGDRRDAGRLVRPAGDGGALLDEVAVLAGVGQLVGDRAVVKQRGLVERVPAEVDPGLRLEEQVDEDIDDDQRDRDDRLTVGRQIVLEREQGPARVAAR
jgi:hypothetical protein